MKTTETASYLASAIFSLIATFPLGAFVIRYHVVSKGAWRRNDVGRMLMALACSLVVVLLFIAFNSLWVIFIGPLYSYRGIIGLALFATLCVTFWNLWRTFEKNSKAPDKENK